MQVKLRQVIKESKDGNKLLAFLGTTYNLQIHMNRPSLQRSPVEEVYRSTTYDAHLKTT